VIGVCESRDRALQVCAEKAVVLAKEMGEDLGETMRVMPAIEEDGQVVGSKILGENDSDDAIGYEWYSFSPVEVF